MKKLSLLTMLFVLVFASSCVSVRVMADYDQKADFTKYKTFAFFKEGIDQVPISDLDKKRILNAITQNLEQKGMNLSENPDLLVNIFTKENERVDVYNNNIGFGWGWGPFWGTMPYSVSTQTEGTLYIELIDNQKKELIWQGQGTGNLSASYANVNAKNERIREFVNKILEQYPPSVQTK